MAKTAKVHSRKSDLAYPLLEDILPAPKDTRPERAVAVTIGDLHGNIVLLLNHLITAGVISLSREDYDEISRLSALPVYREKVDGGISKGDFDKLILLIRNKVKVNWVHERIHPENPESPTVLRPPRALVRLIGDEVADRGACDYYMLVLLETLKKQQCPFEILHSNHGAEFIGYLESKKPGTFRSIINPCDSLDGMRNALNAGFINKQEVRNLVDSVYKPSLKCLSYSLHDDGSITFFSHAPINLTTVNHLANFFGIPYRDDTREQLVDTIDRINFWYKGYIASGDFYREYMARYAYQSDQAINSEIDPLYFIAWNRNYEGLKRNFTSGKNPTQYAIHFVHGHDSTNKGNDLEVATCLDSHFGKPGHEKNSKHSSEFFLDNGQVKRMPSVDYSPPLPASVPMWNHTMADFCKQLEAMEIKAADLHTRGYLAEAQVAKTLRRNCLFALLDYTRNPTAKATFDKIVADAMDRANPTLSAFRGWKEILTNLGICIAMGVVPYLIVNATKWAITGSFGFFTDTDSRHRMRGLSDAAATIKMVTAPCA